MATMYYDKDAEKFDLSVGAKTIDVKADDKIQMLAEKTFDLTSSDQLKIEAQDVEIPFGNSLNAGAGVIDAKKAKVVILSKVEMS